MSKVDKKNNPLVILKHKLKTTNQQLYKKYKSKLSDQLVLVNSIIDDYALIFESTEDLTKLNLSDATNQLYFEMFVYALNANHELANDFFNYYLFSIQLAFNHNTNQWDLNVLKNILVFNKRNKPYDLSVIYVLISYNFEPLKTYVENLDISPKLQLNHQQIYHLFDLIINQTFLNDLFHSILIDHQFKDKLKTQDENPNKGN